MPLVYIQWGKNKGAYLCEVLQDPVFSALATHCSQDTEEKVGDPVRHLDKIESKCDHLHREKGVGLRK